MKPTSMDTLFITDLRLLAKLLESPEPGSISWRDAVNVVWARIITSDQAKQLS